MQKRKQEQKKEEIEVIKPVSTVAEWESKFETTFQLALPSGIEILARKLNLIDLAVTGYIPLDLIGNAIKAAQSMDSADKWETIKEEELISISTMVNKAVLRSVIKPKITETGEEGTIDVNKICFVDKFFIFSRVIDTTGVDILKPFRG